MATLNYALMYAEVNLFCIILLLIILIKLKLRVDKRQYWMLFMKAISFLIIYMLSDVIWCLQDTGLIRLPALLCNGINVVYFLSLLIVSYYYFVYSETVQDSMLVNTVLKRILCSIPLWLLGIIIFFCGRTGWIFSLDEAGHYVRGPYYPVQPLLCSLYVCFTSVKAFHKSLMKVNYSQKSRYLALASFMIAPMAANVAQFFLEGIPILCIGTTLCVLLIYLDMQESMISMDSLTGMNNRKLLMRFLSNKLKYRSAEEEEKLYFLIMDIDSFKKINDSFGHNEGDRALALVGTVLKKICGSFGCFGARYGGDEFVLIFETKQPEQLDLLMRAINEHLDAEVAAVKLPYNLKVSIGASVYTQEVATIPDLIIAADRLLYEEKARKKAALN